jgi:hypothetical protein
MSLIQHYKNTTKRKGLLRLQLEARKEIFAAWCLSSILEVDNILTIRRSHPVVVFLEPAIIQNEFSENTFKE